MINFICNKSRLISLDLVGESLSDSFNINHLTNGGPCVSKLENLIRKKLEISDNKAIIATSSGTAALHALIGGLIIKEGELKFATQSFTFPSSAQQILKNVYIVDIDEEGGIDLNKIPPNIDGIIVTNCFGHLVNVDKYEKWSRLNKKILLFDNAGTALTFWKNKNSLNYGLGTTVSFHHTKPLGFGEGGFVIVNKEYESFVRMCINHGYDFKNDIIKYNEYASNFKMSDISAAFIMAYLKNFTLIKSKHQEIYHIFLQKIEDIKSIKLFPNFVNNPFCNCLPVLFNKPTKLELFIKNGICAKKYYKPLLNTPIATNFYDRIICLPLHIDLNESDLELYISMISRIASGKCE